MKTLLTIIALASAPTLPTAPATVFGIELGKPLTLPECSYSIGAGSKMYDAIPHEKCREFARDDKVPGVTWVPINFPSDQAPLIAKWNYVNAYMMDGVVAGIEFPTAGASSQQTVFEQLKAKFGAPTTVRHEAVQNAMGAQFSIIHADWKRSNLNVTFHGALTDISKGRVEICLQQLCTRRATTEAAEATKQQAL